MPYIRRTDGLAGALAAGHRKLVNVVRHEDEDGLLIAEVGETMDGDEIIDQRAYDSAASTITAHNEALPTEPADPAQQAIDAFVSGDDARRDAALRAIAAHYASR